MAQYSPGIATKNRIIESCRELFYKKGYINTTYNDICEFAQVNPGSIKYHFSDKNNIAAQIYSDMMMFIIQRTPLLFPNEDELVLLILQNGVYQRLFFDDALYRKFSIEFSSEYFSQYNISEYKGLFSNIYNFFLQKMDPKKVSFYFAAFISMDKGIESYIDANINSLTFNEAVTYMNELYYPFIPHEELHAKITRSLELLDTVEIKNTGFAVSMELKSY